MNGSVTLHNSERNETDSFRKFIPCIKLPFVSSNSFAESVTRVRPIDRVMRNDRTQGIYRLKSLNFCWTTGNRWRTDEATERSEIHSCRSETWLENQTGKKKRKRIVLERNEKINLRQLGIHVDREIAICNVNTESLGTIHTRTHRSKTTPR